MTHDRPLGVGGPDLAEHVVGAALREQPPKAPPSGRHLVGDQRGRGRADEPRASARASRPPRRAASPASAPAPASRPIGHQKVPLATGSSSTRTSRAPGVAQRAGQPLRRAPLALGGRAALDTRRAPRGGPASRQRRAGAEISVARAALRGHPGKLATPLPNIRCMAGGGVTLFRVRGIRIAVDYSWFVVLFLIIFWLSGFYRDVLDEPHGSTPRPTSSRSRAPSSSSARSCSTSSATPSWRCATASASPAITLWMFGGFARLEKDSDTPGDRVQDRDRRPAGHCWRSWSSARSPA